MMMMMMGHNLRLAFGLCVAVSTLAGAWKLDCRYPSLIDASAEKLQFGLERGCFSSVDLVNAYIQRINEVNETVHAVTELNPAALKIAATLDHERKAGKSRGPLHGLPILVKGNIAVKNDLQTTAGSYALVGATVPEDATVITKLKEAGAIILGMAGMSQWMNFRASNAPNGWSAYGGQVYGAYHVDQDPSGSSSGSGVAADLGLAFGAIGTETSGSIISPSNVNNIVGIKPTVGLTSRHMVVPVSERADTIGPMTRSVKDAALLLQVVAGRDSNDNYTSAIPFSSTPDYVSACKMSGLRDKRIGIARNALDGLAGAPPILDAFDTAVNVLRDAGAIIVDNANFTELAELTSSPLRLTIMLADFNAAVPRYFTSLTTNPHNITSTADLRAFTQAHPLEEYPARDTVVWDHIIPDNLDNTTPEFWSMVQKVRKLGDEGGLLGALRRDNLDAVILPSSISSDLASVISAPVVTVPMGAWPEDTKVEYDDTREVVQRGPGVPIGLSFMGDLWSEEQLIGMAYAYEQRSQVRRKLKRVLQPRTELGDDLHCD